MGGDGGGEEVGKNWGSAQKIGIKEAQSCSIEGPMTWVAICRARDVLLQNCPSSDFMCICFSGYSVGCFENVKEREHRIGYNIM